MVQDKILEGVTRTLMTKIEVGLVRDLGFIPERLKGEIDPFQNDADHILFELRYFMNSVEKVPEVLESIKEFRTAKDGAKEYFLSKLPVVLRTIAKRWVRVQYKYSPVVLRKYNTCPHFFAEDYQSHLLHLEGFPYAENRSSKPGEEISQRTNYDARGTNLSTMQSIPYKEERSSCRG